MPREREQPRAGDPRRPGAAAPRALAVTALALLTTGSAQVLVSGLAPGAAALLVGAAAALVVAALTVHRGLPVGLLGAQLAVHGVLALTQPTGCLQAVGRAAGAGLDLAVWGAASVCGPGAGLAPPDRLVLTAALTGVALLAAHALATLAGAAWLARLGAAVDAVRILVGAVLRPLVAPAPLVVARRPQPPVAADVVPLPSVLAARRVLRRGPPLVLAA